MEIDAHELIKLCEGQHIEFKESFGSEKEAVETLFALANAEGGTLLIGVADSGQVTGTHLGRNTLENFVNRLFHSTEPPLYVSLTTHPVDARTIVVISVRPPRQGELYYAFGKPQIRVGKINQFMSPQEQREKLLSGQKEWYHHI